MDWESILHREIRPEEGLGEELFLAVSSLVPIVNVDLLVYDSRGRFLLSWRDDPYCGCGWHVPGGCIRFRETCKERIRKVALNELGIQDILYDTEPIKVFEIINHEHREIENQNARGHFITLVYKCYAPDGFSLENQRFKEGEAGYLKWFNCLPDNLLAIQSCYHSLFNNP